jgi:N6-adenosine-specific RNA methylase IME4
MDSIDIGALKVWSRTVADLAAPDAGLFLWCTSANIKQAIGVAEAWGFEYKTNAAWDKQRTGTGYIFLNQHEHLTYASRGNFPMPLEKFSSVFSYPRGEHSAKPNEVRQALESMYPRLTEKDRIELFARGEIPGWTTWGNEA